MKLSINLVEWEYPSEFEKKEAYKDFCWDLSSKTVLNDLYMLLSNGTIVEMKVTADSNDALSFFMDIAKNIGACKPVELNGEVKETLWLYEEGYMVLKQGRDNYIFVNPNPLPEKFS